MTSDPAYLAIGDARKALGMPPVLALTATATEQVVAEILESLYVPDAKIVNAGVERENLYFSVFPTVNNEAKLARITTMLEEEDGTGIIYTASVRSANELHDWLREHGISVGHYHGQMKIRDREAVQQAFMRGEHKVMIATKAFGLGIDKPDIRFVYHYEFPDSLETYYQEAGRAGRDGLPSRAALLYRLEDKRIQSFFLAGRYPKISDLQAVWLSIAGPPLTAPDQTVEARPPAAEAVTGEAPTTDDSEPERMIEHKGRSGSILTADAIADFSGVGRRKTQVILHLLQHAGVIRRGRRGYVPKHTAPPSDEAIADLLRVYGERAAHDNDRLCEMMHYAETSDCRVQIIRQYFSENAGEPCGRCDNCERLAQNVVGESHTERVQAEAQHQISNRMNAIAAAAEPHPPYLSHTAGNVTRVETMHGIIMTTAPETLPQTDSTTALTPGDHVRHKRFGPGTVRDAHGDVALIRFSKGGEKKVKVSFLSRSA